MVSIFLMSLIGVTALLIIVIVVLLVTGKGHIGKKVGVLIKKNVSLDNMLQIAKKKKWNEKEVKLYYLLYIMQDYTKNGYNLDEIQSMATDSGWPQDLVEIVSKKLR